MTVSSHNSNTRPDAWQPFCRAQLLRSFVIVRGKGGRKKTKTEEVSDLIGKPECHSGKKKKTKKIKDNNRTGTTNNSGLCISYEAVNLGALNRVPL